MNFFSKTFYFFLKTHYTIIMKSIKNLFLGVVLIMSTITSCATNSSKETAATTSSPAFKATGMQKKMAEKAVKSLSENNPINAWKFTADPAVLVYNDTIYIYGTNDFQQVEYTAGLEDNGYGRINTLNIFSSKDLVNWTDCGEVKVAGPDGAAKWARNSWAPAIAVKNIDGKDKFFLYFADSANGIGVLSADSPTGPFTDPLGVALVSRAAPNMQGVYWLFDPAVFVDDDGTGYIYFGGGLDKDAAHPKSARCARLQPDMISLDTKPAEIDAPYLFEDSGINKINGKYYYSYCSNWIDRGDAKGPEVPSIASICYMTSDNPLGPFTYQGETLLNPGRYFGPWGNNHHWIFQLKGKWYIAYHTQTMEKTVGLLKGGYRNIFISDFKIDDDGTIPVQSVTKAGPERICAFNPYETIPAATLRTSKNLVITLGKVFPIAEDAYLEIDGADLSKGASSITVKPTAGSRSGTLKITLDREKGPELATITLKGDSETTAKLTLPSDFDSSVLHKIFFIYNGDFALESWKIEK